MGGGGGTVRANRSKRSWDYHQAYISLLSLFFVWDSIIVEFKSMVRLVSKTGNCIQMKAFKFRWIS